MKIATSFKAMAADPNIAVKKNDLFRVDPLLMGEEEGFNLRDYNDPDVISHIEGFADSYSKGRFVPPLIVRVTVDGRIVPVEGHCRRRGALLAIKNGASLPFIDCVPFRGGDVECVEVMLRSAEGLKLKQLQIAIGYLRLHRMGHSNATIANSMRKSPARVEQMLLLATANHDVHELVRSGAVTADAAIEAIREYRENAGDFLSGKFKEAQDQGKTKVTRGVMRGPSLPPKVLASVIVSLESMVSRMDKVTRLKLAELERLEPGQLEGKTIEIDASALLDLVRAQVAVEEVKTKRETAAAAVQAAASQQELAMDLGLEVDSQEVTTIDDDELIQQATKIVKEDGRASISTLQRKLRIGYNRAARILEALEVKGIVTSVAGSDERRVV